MTEIFPVKITNDRPQEQPPVGVIEYTERGFAIFARFTDAYGTDVRVQESSAAMEDHVWIFTHPAEEDKLNNCMHLTVEQATTVRDALDAWLAMVSS